MAHDSIETPDEPRQRRLLIAAVVIVAFVGFFVGIRQEQHRLPYSEAEPRSDASGAPAARSHETLATNPWRTDLAPWAPARAGETEPVTPENREAYEAALRARAERRAFAGAPPTIPHPIAQGSALECRVCHDEGATIAGVTAPPMSHPAYTMCTQCHAPEVATVEPSGERSAAAAAETTFVGRRGAPAPYQWAGLSPPQTPHRVFMRERCGACHGPAGRPGLQTSHPERQMCQQCHTAAAVVDQQPGGLR